MLAGGLYARYQWNPTVFAAGLYVFDLGPVAGPYTLAQPIGKVPFRYPLEAVRLVDGHLVVSSRGIHVLDAAAVVAVRGEQVVARQFEVPLPYPTYEFDTARIGGDNYLFLASGCLLYTSPSPRDS